MRAATSSPTRCPMVAIHRRLTTDAATDMLAQTRLVLLQIAMSRQRGCLHLSTRVPCQSLSSAASANLTNRHKQRSHAQQCCASQSNNSRWAFSAALYVTKVLLAKPVSQPKLQSIYLLCTHGQNAMHQWPECYAPMARMQQ